MLYFQIMSLDASELMAACRAALPGRPGMDIRSINPLPGKQHTLVAFHLIDGEARTPLILRRYPSPLGWAGPNLPGKARREFEMLRWLRGRDLLSPEAVGLGRDASGDWLLERAISGRHWWLPLGSVNFNRALPGLVRQMVRLLGRLHSLELDDLPTEAALVPTITVRGVIQTWHAALRRSGDRHVVEAIERISGLMSTVQERPPRLLHLNVEMENVLVDEAQQIVGWLDWDQVALGDPRWDVALLVDSLYGAYALPDLARWAVTDYGRETVRPVKDIRLWAALIAVLRWAQCSWLAEQVRRRRKLSFPSSARFLDSYGSQRAWAMQLLNEAERAKDDTTG